MNDHDRSANQHDSPVDPRKQNPFPENELPKFLFRQAIAQIQGLRTRLSGYPYRELAIFTGDLSRCLKTVGAVSALELCIKPIQNTPLGRRWARASGALQNGVSLRDALSTADDLLPAFFLPVIDAGDQSGRIDDALEYLHKQCKQLREPAAAVRNLWLYPLLVMMAGSAVSVLLALVLGSPTLALSTLASELFGWIRFAVIIAVLCLPVIKPVIDRFRLMLPYVGQLEREIAVNRFFRVLGLMYCVGAHRVETMIEIANRSVSNLAARQEFSQAAQAIKNQQTITEAFRPLTVLTPQEIATVEVGDTGGRLEQAFENIADQAEDSLTHRLEVIKKLAARIVMRVVSVTVVITALRVMMATSM